MADDAAQPTGGSSSPEPMEYIRVNPDGSTTSLGSQGPQSKPVSTRERDLQHTNVARKRANGHAQLNAGATAQQQKEEAYNQYRKLTTLAKQRQQEAYDRTLAENKEYYKGHPWIYAARKLMTGDDDMLEKEANAKSFDRDQTSFLNPQEAAAYNQAQKTIAGNIGGAAHALGTGLVDSTGIASEEHPENSDEALHQQASTNQYPLLRFLGTVGPGIFFGFRGKKGGQAPKGETPSRPEPETKPPTPPPKPSPTTAGEPVSVANGEYLETWRDFFIPGTLGFDGSRYMGLKLALPAGYDSPLGPCQISMFDEVFSNPARGKLLFHNADGKAIDFDRPFNFLPAINAAYPHLELKAPWLKQLVLKDRGIIKHFKQYDDDVYRLEKIEDLNGNMLSFQRSELGWLEKVEGPDGLSLNFENDAQGHRIRITLIGTDGSELELARYAFDSKGRMREAACAFGMSVHYVWEPDRNLLSSWNNLTRQSETHFTYDDDGRVVHTRTNGIWNNDRFDYRDGETRYLPGGTDAKAQTFHYDDHENITAEIDALGGVVAHGYDRHGFRISTKNQNGHECRTRYDAHGNIKEVTDPEGRSTVYGWGDNGELLIAIDGAGNKRIYKHDDHANVISEKDAEGHETQLVRDAGGRVVETRFGNGAIERRTWDEHNRLASITDAKGNTSRFTYDAFGRLIETIGPTGAVATRTYSAGAGGFDTVSAITRPDGVKVMRSFDGGGQLASVTDGEGRMWRYRYGAFGVLEAIIDSKGGELKLSTDIEGRVISVTNAMGRVYSFERDVAGRVVVEEDFDGRIWRYARDAAGQITETIKPDGAKLRYSYDRSGLVKRIESFTSKGAPEDVTRFWYDARGLLTTAENKAALVKFERDRNGRIIGESQNGKRIKSGRDAMGSRISRTITGPGGSLTEYIRDPLGIVERMVAGETEISFKHDIHGRETERRLGGFHLMQRFDAAGQLAAQAAGPATASGLDVSRLGWNIPGGGEPSARARPGQIYRVYGYDRAFAPISIDDGLWGKRQFAYDDNGQLTDADASFGSERFEYDEARNLAGASSSINLAEQPTNYGRAFDDTFGSLVPADKPKRWQTTAGGVVQMARGPKGERIQLTHDDCGRLIERKVERDGFRPQRWRYRWDVHDRLVGVTTLDGEEWLFGYDPFGRRVSKVKRFFQKERERVALRWPAFVGSDGVPLHTRQSSGTAETDTSLPIVGTAYLWDGDHMVAEAPLSLDGQINWRDATHWYFEDGSHRLMAKQLPSGDLLAVVCDHLGTPKEMFTAEGNLVWAADLHVWGAIRSTRTFGALATKRSSDAAPDDLHCPWRFPGQYEDQETGHYYNRHRHYDPLTGHYASPDPIGLAGGDRPQGYVVNPEVFIDPMGLEARANYQRPAPTASPNWSTARTNYWRDIGESEAANPTGKYSAANIDRMEKGRAPMLNITVRSTRNGQTRTIDVPMELHHNSLTQRGGSMRANEQWNLVPSTPWGHEAMDPFRFTGYELIKINRGTNSW